MEEKTWAKINRKKYPTKIEKGIQVFVGNSLIKDICRAALHNKSFCFNKAWIAFLNGEKYTLEEWLEYERLTERPVCSLVDTFYLQEKYKVFISSSLWQFAPFVKKNLRECLY